MVGVGAGGEGHAQGRDEAAAGGPGERARVAALGRAPVEVGVRGVVQAAVGAGERRDVAHAVEVLDHEHEQLDGQGAQRVRSHGDGAREEPRAALLLLLLLLLLMLRLMLVLPVLLSLLLLLLQPRSVEKPMAR